MRHLYRGPDQRPHRGAGIARIDQQPHPCQRVSDLGARQHRPGAVRAVWDRTLLQRTQQLALLPVAVGQQNRDPTWRDLLVEDQPLDVGRDRQRLHALLSAPPEADLPAGAAEILDHGCNR